MSFKVSAASSSTTLFPDQVAVYSKKSPEVKRRHLPCFHQIVLNLSNRRIREDLIQWVHSAINGVIESPPAGPIPLGRIFSELLEQPAFRLEENALSFCTKAQQKVREFWKAKGYDPTLFPQEVCLYQADFQKVQEIASVCEREIAMEAVALKIFMVMEKEVAILFDSAEEVDSKYDFASIGKEIEEFSRGEVKWVQANHLILKLGHAIHTLHEFNNNILIRGGEVLNLFSSKPEQIDPDEEKLNDAVLLNLIGAQKVIQSRISEHSPCLEDDVYLKQFILNCLESSHQRVVFLSKKNCDWIERIKENISRLKKERI